MERLDELLETSDYVVVACDLNEGTRGLLDAACLARLKPQAFIVSVTRAGVFDEEALYRVLADKRIAGAALDVWFRYPASLADAAHNPRPSRFPFHELDNLIMTPHAASWSVAHHRRRWGLVAANLDRLFRGETPRGIVIQAAAP
jgi:phosphoglycerate dehydrogenase-like enzyme